MVERTAYPTVPPQVEYRPTAMGESLAGAVRDLADWSREHRDAVGEARAERDRGATP